MAMEGVVAMEGTGIVAMEGTGAAAGRCCGV